MPTLPIELPIIAYIALIIGGLGLFLFGITFLSANLKSIADGDTFRRLVGKATSNRFKSFGLGAGFTTIIQSSGGTSALSIGLVKAGALDYESAIAIIIGANLGTCITAFLIAIPSISMFMPFITFITAILLVVSKNRKVQLWAKMIFSFSLIFFGIWLMENFTKGSVSGQPWFENMMNFLNTQPWLGLLFGLIVTLCLQSSSAVIGIVQGIYAAAFAVPGSNISLFGVLPMIIGSNIGAVIPSILSCIGGSQMSKRVAFLNTFMKVSVGLLFMILLYPLKNVLLGSANWTLDPKLQIAITHLTFNVISAIIFLPMIKPLGRFGNFVFKEKENSGDKKIIFKELDPKIIKQFPATGISLAGDLAYDMFVYASKMFITMDKYMKTFEDEDKEYIQRLENTIDKIDRHLTEFLLHAETGTLNYSDQITYGRIIRGIKDVERIGDYGDGLLTFYSNAHEKNEEFNESQKIELYKANEMSSSLIKETIDLVCNVSREKAINIIRKRREYNATLESYQEAYFKREIEKRDSKEKNTYLSLVYVDILNSYERVNSHCSNIAKLYYSDKDYSNTISSDDKKFSAMSSRY